MQAKKLASGTILRGEYVLLGVIGDGASNVFRAHHRRDNRLVAVRIQQLDTVAASTHNLDLPNTALRLRDPLLAAVEASGQTKEGFFFVVNEYISGQRMDQWADKVGIPPLGAVIELVQRVARAMQTLHVEGIAHGALNPRNLVLLRSDSGPGQTLKAKLLDLGVPSFMRPHPPRLRSSYFMAPEQLARLLRNDGGATQECDSRMDVYALGCLLYYLCTGGPPYQGRSLGELIAAHTSEKLLSPSRINPRIPAALEATILRTLSNDPNERPADGGELAGALAEIRRTSSVSGVILRPPTPSSREASREPQVELGEIFADFAFEERPTSQIPIVEDSPTADAETVPPPPDMGELDSGRPLPPVSAVPLSGSIPPEINVPPVRLSPAPPAPQAARVSSVPAPAPAQGRVSPLPAPAQGRASPAPPPIPQAPPVPVAARASVPAGSFSSEPPPQSAATDRLSIPFRPAARSQSAAMHQSALPSQPPFDQAALDAEVEAMARPARFAWVPAIDRRWLAVPFAGLAALIVFLVLREPPAEDQVIVSALEVEPARSAAPQLPVVVPRAAPQAAKLQPVAAPRRETPAAPPSRAEARPVPPSARPPLAHNAHATRPSTNAKAASAPPPAAPAPLVLRALEGSPEVLPEPDARQPVAREPEPQAVAPEPEAPRGSETHEPPALEPRSRPAAERAAAASTTPAEKPEAKARPASFAASVSIREFSVRGSLATSDVKHTVERVEAQLAQCYQSAARAAGRNAFGELNVEVTLDENGRADKPSASGGALPGLNACVAQVAGKLVSSRRPDTGTVKATFKLAFTAKTP